MNDLHWRHTQPDGGVIEVTCPTGMTGADIEDFQELFALIVKTLRRNVPAAMADPMSYSLYEMPPDPPPLMPIPQAIDDEPDVPF